MPAAPADARQAGFEQGPGGILKAHLDNGCYVARVPAAALPAGDGLRMLQVIGEADGARHLSHFRAVLDAGASAVLEYRGSDAVAFVRSGRGAVQIGGESFPVAAETGVCIKPGESFRFVNEGRESMMLALTVCPPCAAPAARESLTPVFDAAVPDRVQGVDPQREEATGDRFFQVLIGERTHRTPVTQFIGRIPPSRAPHHRHPYEEAIVILEGEGFMWTDASKAPVQPGDVVFLPRRQMHSLECTAAGGMRVLGVFFPSMSPAVNY